MHIKRLSSPRSARPLLWALLVLLFALAACGNDAPADEAAVATEASVAEAAVATAIVAPTEAPAEAAPAPTTAPEPTAAPAEPTPTLAVAAETGALPAGNCANEFFPVREGLVQRYTTNIPGLDVSEHTMTYSEVSDSSFVVATDIGDGDAIVHTWQCSGDGLLSPELTTLPGGEEFSIEFVEATGVTLPPADRFQPGESWTNRYVANATLGDPAAPQMTMSQTVELTHTVTGEETISVPAGTFPDAVRVETIGNVNIVMSIDGAAAPANDVPMTYTSWYVAGVGLVRQEFTGLFADASEAMVTELVATE